MKSRHPSPHQALLIALRAPLPSIHTIRRWISSFNLVTSSHMTCTGLFCQHKRRLSQSQMFSLTGGPPRAMVVMNLPVCYCGSWMPYLVQDETMQSGSCHKNYQIPLFQGERATKTPSCANHFASVFGTQRSMCSRSCQFDGALSTVRDLG